MSRNVITLDVATEQVGKNLLSHLEQQAGTFSIAFLFAEVAPALALTHWLDDRLTRLGTPLQWCDAPDDFAERSASFFEQFIGNVSELASRSGAVCLLLERHPDDEAWNEARRALLAALVEETSLFEIDLKRPLVIVLPKAFKVLMPKIAADLWHMRDFGDELRADGNDAYIVWLINVSNGVARGYLPTARRMLDELSAAGRHADAAVVAGQAVVCARNFASLPTPSPNARRDLSVALDYAGRVAQTQRQFGDAESAYRESLAVRRELAQSADTPESLRDVAESLYNVGSVARAQQHWAEAERAFAERVDLYRRIAERVHGSFQSLRDLCSALSSVEQTAQQQGKWIEAESAFVEATAVRGRSEERRGGPPEDIRDIARTLDNMGRAAQGWGHWATAETAYRESLAIRRNLVDRLEGSPLAWRDVSISHDNLGSFAEAQCNWSAAESAYRESLAIRQKLIEELEGAPQALRDLCVSFDNLGRIAYARKHWEDAHAAYQKSFAMRQTLVARFKRSPPTLRDLCVSLDHLARLAHARENWEVAQEACQESLAIRRHLVEWLGQTPATLRDLTVALNNMGRVAQAQQHWDDARSAYEESLAIHQRLMNRPIGFMEAADIAKSFCDLGHLAGAQNNWVAAEAAYRKSVEFHRQFLVHYAEMPEALDRFGSALICLGIAQRKADQALFDETALVYAKLVDKCPLVAAYRERLHYVTTEWPRACQPGDPGLAAPTCDLPCPAPSAPAAPFRPESWIGDAHLGEAADDIIGK